MTSKPVDLNRFLVQQLEGQYRTIKLAAEELTDEQLSYQPTADANSIAWLMWHLSRWRDMISATCAGVPQVWSRDGWAERFGLPEATTGLGDTPEQVASFKVERGLLFGYLDAAHAETVTRITQLTPAQFEQSIEYLPGTNRSAWEALAGMSGDSYQHAGQIACLRGMIEGYGWRERVGQN